MQNCGCQLTIVCVVYRVIPQYLMYRPANSVPYATVEADLKGVFLKYCKMDPKGRLLTQTVSEVEQKCGTFQHWIHQWTHGNLLVTQLEGRTCAQGHNENSHYLRQGGYVFTHIVCVFVCLLAG